MSENQTWEEICVEFLRPRLDDVVSQWLVKPQIDVLARVHSEAMEGNTEKFMDWFYYSINTLENVQEGAQRRFPLPGAKDKHWPVTYNGDFVAIHFLSPLPSPQDGLFKHGDCFFQLPVLRGKPGTLSFKYFLATELTSTSIPIEQFESAFTIDYLTNILDKLSVKNGCSRNDFRLLLMDKRGRVERVSVDVFLLPPIHTPNMAAVKGQLVAPGDGYPLLEEKAQRQLESGVSSKQASTAQPFVVPSFDSSVTEREFLNAPSSRSDHYASMLRSQTGDSGTDQRIRRVYEKVDNFLNQENPTEPDELPPDTSSNEQQPRAKSGYDSVRFEHLASVVQKELPAKIIDIPFKLRTVLSAKLDLQDDMKPNDWRMLAHFFGSSNSDIKGIDQRCRRRNTSQTFEVLDKYEDRSCAQLIDGLLEINQNGLLDNIHAYYLQETKTKKGVAGRSFEGETRKSFTLPLNRSVSSPVEADNSYDVLHRGRANSGPSRSPVQVSSESDYARVLAEKKKSSSVQNLYDKDAKEFWYSIKSDQPDAKSWVSFIEAVKKNFGDVPADRHFSAEKSLFATLVPDAKYRDRKDVNTVVTEEAFTRLIKWFGPCSDEEDGFLKKIFDLTKRSRIGLKRDSWFAGHMTSEDEEKLEKAESGAFLVRFSDTDIDEGGFSLEVKHEDDIEKFAIRAKPESQQLFFDYGEFAKEPYYSLPNLIEHIKLRGIPLGEGAILLKKACRGLKFSKATSAYK